MKKFFVLLFIFSIVNLTISKEKPHEIQKQYAHYNNIILQNEDISISSDNLFNTPKIENKMAQIEIFSFLSSEWVPSGTEFREYDLSGNLSIRSFHYYSDNYENLFQYNIG